LSEDAWSYTNCSSDSRTDADFSSEIGDVLDHERQVEDLLTDELDFLDETAGKHHETAASHDIAAEITAAESVHNIIMGPSADKAALLAAEDAKIVSKAAFDNDKSEVLSENNNISVVPAQTNIALELSVDKSKPLENTSKQIQLNKNKGSRWKKISQMVKWTPFIQTYRKRKYPWVQLAGHSGSFMKGSQGTVLKKCGEQEELSYRELMHDPLSLVVPQYFRSLTSEGKKYIELSCCLSEFNKPSIMDVKMGVRTFAAKEILSSKPRSDLYEKMICEDMSAPNTEEHQSQSITKYRYLDWRDRISSSRDLGFRIEAQTSKGKSRKDFKSVRNQSEVENVFKLFADNPSAGQQYLQRLQTIRSLCSASPFFKSHEMIGSSLLFVHDDKKASVWLIDFEKSCRMPENQKISHNVPWTEGTREDGYLIGIDSLISIFSNLTKLDSS